MAAVLMRFARLYELAHKPADAVSSAAGKYKSDGELALADLVDEVPPDKNGEAAHTGYQTDYCVEYGPTPDSLYKIAYAGAFTTIAQNGKPGSERHPNFRIRHSFRNQKVDGEITRTFRSWAETRGSDGKWYRIRETLDRPRGPDRGRDDDDFLTWTHTICPRGNAGSVAFTCAAEERLDARQQLDTLRGKIGAEAFEVLRMAAAERNTARQIGEGRGTAHKRASALGGELLEQAIAAANDSWPLSEVG